MTTLPPPPPRLAGVLPPPPPRLRALPPPPPRLAVAPTAKPAPLIDMPAREKIALDVECFPDYFLVSAKRIADRVLIAELEAFPGQPLDVVALSKLLATYTIVTFNGKGFDEWMLAGALAGYDIYQLKWLCDQIIVRNLRGWELEREFKLHIPPYLDGIDLMEIMPGQHGLKMYMAKMHSRRIQDLPHDPNAVVPPELRPTVRTYCANDLEGNIDGYRQFEKEIKLREKMSAEYGVDLRSKSDAQIAEVVIVHELGGQNAVPRPEWAIGTYFHYDPPAYVQFATPLLQQLLDVVRRARFVLGDKGIDMPPELDNANIKIGNSVYRLGIGGLHSSEKSTCHHSDGHFVLQDVDVASFYPRLMLNSGAFPQHMGPRFLQVFEAIVNRRLENKGAAQALEDQHGKRKTMAAAIAAAFDDATSAANSLKIVINGTFGKTLSKYGKLVAPKMGIQTTITGQLSLLMLIEWLEAAGIHVVSANTDGIVIKCPRALTWLRDEIVRQWEKRCGLETEATDYAAIYSRDVNNYIAVKPSGEVKTKGAYAETKPVGGSWPNPTGYIAVEAVIAWLKDRTPLEYTVRGCRDIRKFVHVRTVNGGGVKYYGDPVEKVTTQGAMRAQLEAAGWVEVEPKMFVDVRRGSDKLPMKDAYKEAFTLLRSIDTVRTEYLGKVVRWYYAKDMPGAIRYKTSGNLVPRTEGAAPLMELPDAMPEDVDYDWYVRDAKSMLADIGAPVL